MTKGKKPVKDTSVCTIFSQSSTNRQVNAAVITSAKARFHDLLSRECSPLFFFNFLFFFLPGTDGYSVSDRKDDMI